MSIAEFLAARLDVDEAVALDATAGPWQQAPTTRRHITATGSTEEIVYTTTPEPGAISLTVASTGVERDRQNLRNAEHIARHDPARALREIASKRAILELHANGTPGVDYCKSCWDGNTPLDWPCPTLRALAAVHADHPDYEPEWAPRT